MHLRGVLASADISANETVTAAISRKFPNPIDGDVVVNTNDGTEYVYADGAWHELGNENNHATKSALELEKDARISADNAIQAAVDKKIYINDTSATSLSIQNISRDAYHDLVVNG